MNRDMNESEVPNPTESESAAEAIIEILSEAQVEAELDEAIIVAKELFEEFTSPLLIQRAAGATSSVVITGSPAGGVDNARSTKGRKHPFQFERCSGGATRTCSIVAVSYARYLGQYR